ncbi:Uncharacterized protein GBIM_02086 [Gryllus bimaculatus]|nr:Uncharacterized protein GBIM_02086 [Gryllus bimaculatus]
MNVREMDTRSSKLQRRGRERSQRSDLAAAEKEVENAEMSHSGLPTRSDDDVDDDGGGDGGGVGCGLKRAPLDIRNRPRIPVPDEDPYSVAGSGGSGGSGSSGASSGGAGGVVAAAREQLLQQREALLARGRADRPPKLPPRDPSYPQPQPHDIPKVRPTAPAPLPPKA